MKQIIDFVGNKMTETLKEYQLIRETFVLKKRLK
jgi:hypothetical protein